MIYLIQIVINSIFTEDIMNRKIGMIGSVINAITVAAFAICMMIRFNYGSYLVCIFLSLSFICMIAALAEECTEDNRVAGKVAMILAGVYATFIMAVYFTQCTTVHNEILTGDAERILNYSYLGLFFNFDMLGYGIMALSTFFIGLTINVKNKKDKALKILLLVHGIFFLSCTFMPMTGMFVNHRGSSSMGGAIALEIWCLYFLPISILSWMHFKESE